MTSVWQWKKVLLSCWCLQVLNLVITRRRKCAVRHPEDLWRPDNIVWCFLYLWNCLEDSASVSSTKHETGEFLHYVLITVLRVCAQNVCSKVFLWQLSVNRLVKKFTAFMEPKNSQKPCHWTIPYPTHFSSDPVSLRLILILSSHSG
jgi:hypothetical protein